MNILAALFPPKPPELVLDRLCELAVENALLKAKSNRRAVRKDAHRYQDARDARTAELRAFVAAQARKGRG